MNRFIRKSWYTLTEAAQYLTQSTQGEARVTVADILQIALEAKHEVVTLRLFSPGVVDTGDLLTLAPANNHNGTPALEALANSRILFCAPDEIASTINAFELVEHGPPPVVFEPHRSQVSITGEAGLIPVGAGKALLNSLWRSALAGNSNNDKLLLTDESTEPELAEMTIFLGIHDTDAPPIARVAMSALPPDAYMGVSKTTLEALLPDEGGPQGGQSSRTDQIPEDIDLLLTAWRLFWRKASPRDKTTWPLNDDVRDWLMGKGMSKRLADPGATMIAPDWARKGGRR